jgi:hypothetical protein
VLYQAEWGYYVTLSLRLSGDNKLLVFKPARLRLSLSKPLVRVGPGLAPAALAVRL